MEQQCDTIVHRQENVQRGHQALVFELVVVTATVTLS